ncbi:MAG: hypothetical protein ABI301_06730, partial [Jatrophihabitantaceae bacterium]
VPGKRQAVLIAISAAGCLIEIPGLTAGTSLAVLPIAWALVTVPLAVRAWTSRGSQRLHARQRSTRATARPRAIASVLRAAD